jgi:hypothetical protein
VHLLTEDKLQLARALLNSAQRLSTHQEQTEWLAGQCEVWRSKFLASRSVSLHNPCFALFSFPNPHTVPRSQFSSCCCNLSIRICVTLTSVSFHDVFNLAYVCLFIHPYIYTCYIFHLFLMPGPIYSSYNMLLQPRRLHYESTNFICNCNASSAV